MKKTALIFIVHLYMMSFVLLSCKDDDNANPAPPIAAACVIQSETTTSPGDISSLEYEFDEAGYLSRINRFDKFRNNTNVFETFALHVVSTKIDKFHPTSVATSYDADYLISSPFHGNVSITMDGVTTTDWNTYLFTYDTQGRLKVVSEQTPNIPNDYEWELTITYDKNDNVTSLRYDLTTGPREDVVVIEVQGYDDKPTPYAAISGWKYMINHASWNYSDPTRLIVSLSKNNPLKLQRIVKGVLKEENTMEYLYNDKGFPTQCSVALKTDIGQSSWVNTFTYQCK
jgi:hypothetical protein